MVLSKTTEAPVTCCLDIRSPAKFLGGHLLSLKSTPCTWTPLGFAISSLDPKAPTKALFSVDGWKIIVVQGA